jgi:hypothetical protein
MNDRWLVQINDENGSEKSLTFETKEKAEEFIQDRVEMVRHLGYDPDEIYYLIPIQ